MRSSSRKRTPTPTQRKKPQWKPGRVIVVKRVQPEILEYPEKLEQLRQDLQCMGYAAFLELGWDISSELMLLEVAKGTRNSKFPDHPIRARFANWNFEHWAEIYGFENYSQGYDQTQGDEQLKRKFYAPPSEHDGYRMSDCKDRRERQVLWFLLPILSPDKPTTCTLKLAKAILESFAGRRACGWGLIIDDVVNREVGKLGGSILGWSH
jgi:hypothetical protein